MRNVYASSTAPTTTTSAADLAARRAARDLRLYFESPRYAYELRRQLGEFGHAANLAAIVERPVGSAGLFPLADREVWPA